VQSRAKVVVAASVSARTRINRPQPGRLSPKLQMRGRNRDRPSTRLLGPHIFDRVCIEHGIEHRLTKPYHPWTNGQAERMNRTIKDATIKVYPYDDLESLKAHVLAFVTAYNFAKHLKALRWRTPYQVICEAWTKDPSIFKINPHHLIPGPHT
jgi:transposase InsO family protein